MATSDAEHWDARHAAQRDPVTPAPPDAFDGLDIDLFPTSGAALDVACGRGAQTIWMAQRGLSVTALDASPRAIDDVRELAERLDRRHHSAIAQRVDARVHDLDDGLPADVGSFDVIVCQRFRDPRLYADFVTRLRPGGLLVVTVLSVTGAEHPGAFHAPAGELRAAFDFDTVSILRHTEAHGQESIVLHPQPHLQAHPSQPNA